MAFPVDIRIALERMAEGLSLKSLGGAYQTMSDRYRRKTVQDEFQILSAEEALAYALARMPATYGAVSDVLRRAAQTIPDLNPKTILDLGAGPATATLAALECFPAIESARLIEPNAHLGGLAKALMHHRACEIVHERTTLALANLDQKSDLVLLSYVLNELPAEQIDRKTERAWNATAQALVIIEPGTPAGHALILKIRDRLLALGANIAAPCPHDMACPLAGTDGWCHMSARVERSSLHRKLKPDAALGYEDEKFSYLVATRLPVDRPASRLIGHPHGQKLVSLELCTKDGTAVTRTLSRRDDDYKRAKKLEWGDPL